MMNTPPIWLTLPCPWKGYPAPNSEDILNSQCVLVCRFVINSALKSLLKAMSSPTTILNKIGGAPPPDPCWLGGPGLNFPFPAAPVFLAVPVRAHQARESRDPWWGCEHRGGLCWWSEALISALLLPVTRCWDGWGASKGHRRASQAPPPTTSQPWLFLCKDIVRTGCTQSRLCHFQR